MGSKHFENQNWVVETNVGSILDSKSMDSAEEFLQIPVPEMIFGSSHVTVGHKPSGWKLKFDALDALDRVDKTGAGPGHIELAYSEAWRQASAGRSEHDVTKIHRPFDWTYTTDYRGSETTTNKQLKLEPSTSAEIPVDRLAKHVPILLFESVMLFEDELGDNGMASYTVKVRVMENEMLILAQFYMRADQVLLRLRDTRVFVDFVKGQVIRTYVEKEGDYNTVLSKVPLTAVDTSQPLRDPEWLKSVLKTVSSKTESLTLDNSA